MGLDEATSSMVYMLCTLLLILKVIITNTQLGGVRGKANIRTQEDYEAFKVLKPKTEEEIEKSKAELYRYERMVQNDMENIPYGLVVFWGGHVIDRTSWALVIPFIIFTIARICFTIVYALGKQPHRTITFFVAQFSMLFGAVAAIVISIQNI